MTYLATETMETLVVLIDCRQVALMESGELHAVMDAESMCHVVLDDVHIKALHDRGWLEMDDSSGDLLVNVSPAGAYWGQKWDRDRQKAQRKLARAR